MCGIVGYIGKENAKEKVIYGLEKLEYRGYDSAGIAFLSDGNISVYKDKGRVDNLKKLITKDDAAIAMGHTRWSTHGVPNKTNAHPITSHDGEIVVVHNGVIENEKKLRETELAGITFNTQTDTEVLANLIAKYVKDLGMEKTIQKLHELVHGSFALVIMKKGDTDHVYVTKRRSPMILGVGSDFNMVASDPMAIAKYTKDYLEINDDEFALLTNSEVKLFDKTGNVITRDTINIAISEEVDGKGSYDHYMLKEVDEQPTIIRKLCNEYIVDGSFNIDKEVIKKIKAAGTVYILAAGTSYNAGLIGKAYLESIAQVRSEVLVASEFAYNTPLIDKKPLFIFVSQSGETADLIACHKKIMELSDKFEIVTITNTQGSSLSRLATATLLLHAGREVSVASTKAYTAQVSLFYLLANVIAGNDAAEIKEQLSKVALAMESTLADKDKIKAIVKTKLLKTKSAFIIGRGLDYFAAIEASLKLKEISYIHTEGFAAGELKHGTISLIEDKMPVIALISQSITSLNTRSNLTEVMSRGALPIVISTKSLSYDEDDIIVDEVNEKLGPLVLAVAYQVLSYYTALLLGNDVDKPRNLAKSVTVE